MCEFGDKIFVFLHKGEKRGQPRGRGWRKLEKFCVLVFCFIFSLWIKKTFSMQKCRSVRGKISIKAHILH